MKNQLIYGMSVLIMAGLLPSSLFARGVTARSSQGVRAPLRAPVQEVAPAYEAVNNVINLNGARAEQLQKSAGPDALEVIDNFARATDRAVNSAVGQALPLSPEVSTGLGLMRHAEEIAAEWTPDQQNNVVELKRRTVFHASNSGSNVTFGQSFRKALVDAGYGNSVYSDGVQKRAVELRQSCGI